MWGAIFAVISGVGMFLSLQNGAFQPTNETNQIFHVVFGICLFVFGWCLAPLAYALDDTNPKDGNPAALWMLLGSPVVALGGPWLYSLLVK
jgi:hypothetical protein